LPALRSYLALSLPLHLLWETAQLPLYTIWTTGTAGQKAFAVMHCTAGDLMIASLALLAALLLVGTSAWPHESAGRVFALSLLIGVGFTIYSEWANTLRGSWSYGPLMPVLPWLGTGLSPLLQWIILPAVALSAALRRCR
jgi:hypothetical protein